MRSLRPIVYSPDQNFRIRHRSRLPHFELDGGLYFVTFRTADSLPSTVEAELSRLWDAACDESKGQTPSIKRALVSRWAERYEHELDLGRGKCELRDPRVAAMIVGGLRFFDPELYHLYCWCVMPNHVHVVFLLHLGRNLNRVLHSWKSWTSHEANKILGRKGKLWQEEYFDRIIRDQDEFQNVAAYVLGNPVDAGLKDWPYVGFDPERCK